jgi:hypothetical protein
MTMALIAHSSGCLQASWWWLAGEYVGDEVVETIKDYSIFYALATARG